MKKDKQLSFIKNWEQIAQLETSLGKILRIKSTFNISHENVETIINGCKTLIKTIDILKHQHKQYRSLEDQHIIMQSKLNNHDNIVNNLEKTYAERIKSLIDDSKTLKDQNQKLKKGVQEIEDQYKATINNLRKDVDKLEETVLTLQKEKQILREQLNKKDNLINQKNIEIQALKNVINSEKQQPPTQPTIENIICSYLGSKIIQFLNPLQICSMMIINKKIRLHMIKSRKYWVKLIHNIISIKNAKINYFHNHIQYFQNLTHKIPQQILHTTYYQYHIAKQQLGTQILAILNSSALIFEGKFIDVDANESLDIAQNQTSFKKLIANAENNYLDVQLSIIQEYIEQKKCSRDKILKQIDLMYKKIQSTAQLYSADVQTIGLFLKNVLKNFSKVFVLSKSLYSQSRNLQLLNSFLLGELVKWDKSDINYTNKIQDLKAQLQSERKLKLFFTQKSQKSQQKALTEENSKLNIQMKYNLTLKSLEQMTYEKKQLQVKLEENIKNLKQSLADNKQLKKAYEAGKLKYHEIIEQLSLVKETIIRMNLV